MNMEFMEFSAKTVNDAVTEACKHFTVPSDKLEYEVIEEGSTGFLGFNSKPAVIKARIIEEKLSVEDQAKKFLQDVFQAMNMVVVIDAKLRNSVLSIRFFRMQTATRYPIRRKC